MLQSHSKQTPLAPWMFLDTVGELHQPRVKGTDRERSRATPPVEHGVDRDLFRLVACVGDGSDGVGDCRAHGTERRHSHESGAGLMVRRKQA